MRGETDGNVSESIARIVRCIFAYWCHISHVFCIKGCLQAPFLFFNTKISENIIKYK